jgi:catechol 2,3-dioxygenase-like lactoylglutathione lyase family enzyme
VLLTQELGADGLMLGGGEIGPLVHRGLTLNEACQAFSDIPARDGPLLGTASPETHLLATRYDLHLGELDGFQDRWIAVLPLWLIITAAKVPAGVVQLDSGPGLHVPGLGRLVLEKTVAFYRDGLRLPLIEDWDRNSEDQGTLFGAASGLIEVLKRPESGDSSHFFDERPPQGAFMVIEVEDVEWMYRQVIDKGLPIQQQLTTQRWGHRSFCVREPNGLTLYFFSEMHKG